MIYSFLRAKVSEWFELSPWERVDKPVIGPTQVIFQGKEFQNVENFLDKYKEFQCELEEIRCRYNDSVKSLDEDYQKQKSRVYREFDSWLGSL